MTPQAFDQDVFPMLSYEDGVAAMDWLAVAFGFREVTRMLDNEGKLAHGQMTAGVRGGQIMIASGSSGYESLKTMRAKYPPARQWLEVPWVINGVVIYVADIDGHLSRARNAGATILSELEDGPPARRYRCEDLEGHRWMFIESGAA